MPSCRCLSIFCSVVHQPNVLLSCSYENLGTLNLCRRMLWWAVSRCCRDVTCCLLPKRDCMVVFVVRGQPSPDSPRHECLKQSSPKTSYFQHLNLVCLGSLQGLTCNAMQGARCMALPKANSSLYLRGKMAR